MIKRLSHVCLGATDLERTMEFYCDLLGCRVVHEFRNQQGELYGVFLLVGNGTFLEFFKEQQPKAPDGLFKHICFEVHDIYRYGGVMREKGFHVEIFRGMTDKVLQFWINDPDGNKIEFHQYDEQCVQYKHLRS